MAAIFLAAGPCASAALFHDIREYPKYVRVTPVPDLQSMPEHPGYVVFDLANPQPGQLWPGLSSNHELNFSPPDKEIVDHMAYVLRRNAELALGVIASYSDVPAMLLKPPADPNLVERKPWQPDQINESLLKGRICDW